MRKITNDTTLFIDLFLFWSNSSQKVGRKFKRILQLEIQTDVQFFWCIGKEKFLTSFFDLSKTQVISLPSDLLPQNHIDHKYIIIIIFKSIQTGYTANAAWESKMSERNIVWVLIILQCEVYFIVYGADRTANLYIFSKNYCRDRHYWSVAVPSVSK